MEPISEFLHSLHGERLQDLIQWGGFALLFAIVFAETGLLAGFFLPGDSLLFTAGTVVGLGILKAPSPLPQDPGSSIFALIVSLSVAAIIGDTCGYWFGRKTGPRLFAREDSRLFKKAHLEKTREFYEKHGGKTIILARWMPFARTFAPIVAGVANMPYSTFMLFNVIGGITWVTSMSLLGFFLGGIDIVRKHNEKVIILIVLLSILPAIIHAINERRKK